MGKSVLAAILAGPIVPTTGRCVRNGSVHCLPQQVAPSASGSVADLAGGGAALAALARIESGGCDPGDFEQVGERWNLRAGLQDALRAEGLAGLAPETPAARLSGGEAMRVALAGAWLSEADFLLLDEPGNHLDRGARERLRAHLRDWRRGLLVVNHDRALLRGMERIVELSADGLASHGGGYAAYEDSRQRGQEAAQRQPAHARAARARQRRDAVVLREREQRRQARDRLQRRDANQAAILLDRQQERSEQSAGRRVLLRQQAEAQAAQRVREAAARVADATPVAMFAPVPASARHRRVAMLEEVALPFAPAGASPLSFSITGTQRIGVLGGNGCGKSTLLAACRCGRACGRSLRRARAGRAARPGAVGIAAGHQRARSAACRRARHAEADRRMRLAQLGLDAGRIAVPARVLSGGERLKAALACVLHAAEPPQLLLLDEPDNHLDLASKEALERMLRDYPGALVVVSHDDAFLDGLALDTRLQAAVGGWSLTPW